VLQTRATRSSNLYDPQNPLAVQLKYIAQMISGGLKTKVYILNVNGFDTHDAQVDQNNLQDGTHANLLKRISDAVRAFQHDLQLLGLEQRVAGLTFSEFGRQIASNGSMGTDHGDAAPLILFGACASTGIVGANPQIPNQVNNQAGLPMQIDFRDIYASILKDWFEVDTQNIQPLFEQNITYYDLLQGCTNSVAENTLTAQNQAIVFPNPSLAQHHLKFTANTEFHEDFLLDQSGKVLKKVFEGQLSAGEQVLPIDIHYLQAGLYHYLIKSNTLQNLVSFQKL